MVEIFKKLKNMSKHIVYILLTLILISCKKDDVEIDSPIEQEPILNLSSSNPPFTIDLSSVKFYQDVSYDADILNVFDFFMPNKSTPSSLCIIIHGGGFVSGDKTQPYSSTYFKSLINNLLSNNIAVASINYRFLEDNETEGLLKCLNDSKRALQFMRYYSNPLNFNKQKVVLMGSSAGAGTSLWIGFNDDMADADNLDPILRETTRVQGIVGTSTQSNYDFLEWHNNVFSEYQINGLDFDTVKSIMTETTILKYFGVSSLSELSSSEIITYRNSVNMLDLMSNDDPEFYILTSGVPYSSPNNTSELYHHPLHVKSLKEKAIQTSTAGMFYCPELGIDTRNGENIENFILRKIGE